jgi:rhodanese-related sulfurtransferase
MINLFNIFNTNRNTENPIQNMSPKEINALIGTKGVAVIDVREPSEYREGHIAQAKLMPLNTVMSHVTELGKFDKVIVVCRSGNRSNAACQTLRSSGVKNLINLRGGMIAWAQAGLPIKQK